MEESKKDIGANCSAWSGPAGQNWEDLSNKISKIATDYNLLNKIEIKEYILLIKIDDK